MSTFPLNLFFKGAQKKEASGMGLPWVKKSGAVKLDGDSRLPWSHIDFITGIKKPRIFSEAPTLMVPRGGIEPPTRGFSVPCSTD